MCKACWIISVLFITTTLGMAYKFILQGSVAPASDGRLSIQMVEGERDLVLAEMRGFLAAVQQINEGVAQNDLKKVATAARKVGAAAQEGMPGSLIGKLPLGFKQLGFDTHSKFDALALDAEQFGENEQSLTALSELMQNCVACHAAYRIDEVEN